MCKCKSNGLSGIKKAEEAGKTANVMVSVDVTNIVKYLSLAGVAIVGIIFGVRYLSKTSKKTNEEEE